MSTYYKARQFIRNITCLFWCVWGMLYVKWSELWSNSSRILDDNALLHRAWIVLDYLTKHPVNTIKQSIYSPDLGLTSLTFSIRNSNSLFEEIRFESLKVIKGNMTKEFKTISSSAYEKCMNEWVKHWHVCVALDGCYFEEDKKKITWKLNQSCFI